MFKTVKANCIMILSWYIWKHKIILFKMDVSGLDCWPINTLYNQLKVDLSLNIWIHSLKIPPKLICVVSFGDESLHWLFINNNITLIVQKTKLSSSEWAFISSIIVIIMITIQIVNKIQIGALQHRAWVTCTLLVSRCKNVLNFKLFYSTYGPIQIIMCMDVSCRILPQCVSGMHACIK